MIESVPPTPPQDVIAQVGQFFAELTSAVQNGDQHGGSDQNSYYDDGSDSGPLPDWFMEAFGWMPHVQQMAGAHFWDFLTQDSDPETLTLSYNGSEFSGNYSGGSVSMMNIQNFTDQYLMNVNGQSFVSVWHPGSPTYTNANNDIVVSGGHWTINYAADAYVGNGLNTPGPLQSTPVDNYPSSWDHQHDFNIDHAAANLSADIINMPNSSTTEYRAFLYMLGGVIHKSNIVQGTAIASGGTWAQFGIPAGAVLVADMHNHPAYLPDGSWNPVAVGTDYGDMRVLQEEGSGHTPYAVDPQFRLYVTASGYVNEYDYVQNTAPVPAGDPHTYYPSAVRGGFYPDLGN